MTNMIDSVVQGSVRPALEIAWVDGDDVAMNLTNSSLSGTIRTNATGIVRAIAGTLEIVNAEAGTFRWNLDDADVAIAGQYTVQFVATFSVGSTPARTVPAAWRVISSQEVEV